MTSVSTVQNGMLICSASSRASARVRASGSRRRCSMAACTSCQETLVGLMRSAPHDKADVAFGQILLDIGQALIEEDVVTKIRMGEVGDAREVDHQRQA